MNAFESQVEFVAHQADLKSTGRCSATRSGRHGGAPILRQRRICLRGDARPPLHTHRRESTRNTPPRFRVEKD